MVYKSWCRALLPGTCLLCGCTAGGQADLCADCALELPALRQGCNRCAMPVSCPGEALCGQCLRQPPRFSRCVAAMRYEYPVRELISQFKFQGDLAAGHLLSQLLAARIAALAHPNRADLTLVPVPLHASRLRERGFNQSERIARVLSAHLGIALSNTIIRRLRQSTDQKHLGAGDRNRNLRGAFSASACAGMRIAVIDDVLTTGSTANAVADTLLQAGAVDVQVWCLARAL